MKEKKQPTQTDFGDHLQQALLEGLGDAGRTYAIRVIRDFSSRGKKIPYAIIRSNALLLDKRSKTGKS